MNKRKLRGQRRPHYSTPMHYHDAVALGYELGSTFIFKFGRNSAVSTDIEDICDVGSTYAGWLADGETVTVTADNAADVAAGAGMRSVRVLGLDSDWNPLSEDILLNADTTAGTQSVNPFLRVNRAYGLTAGSDQVNAGDINIAADTTSVAMARITAGSGQTLMALWSVPAGFEMVFESVEITSLATDNVSARVEYNISSDNVWRCQWTGEVEGQTIIDPMPIVVPPMSDIRVRASAAITGGAAGIVSASFLGIMHEIEDSS